MQQLLNVMSLRQQFPALQKKIRDKPVVYLDGPGGTQIPQSVIDAMMDYLIRDNSNAGGVFLNSQQTDRIVLEARRAVADLLNAKRPEEIVFGHNMTTLTYMVSRALSRTWQAGDEIILSKLDHNANIDPWRQAAAERGVTVRWLEVDTADYTLLIDKLGELLTDKTRLVAVTYASNALGSVTDVAEVIKLAHAAGALTYIDAVHYAPHGPIDVQALDCDFLVSSPYKYYGPHSGVLYGKYQLLDELDAYKLRPVSNLPASKWETGTQSFESMAGVRAAVDYLATVGELGLGTNAADLSGLVGRRLQLRRALTAIKQYEAELSRKFITEAAAIRGLTIYGLTSLNRLSERTPTFALRLAQHPAEVVARALARQGIYVWHGHFYALDLMESLQLQSQGGVVRIGFVHYNTTAEIDRLLDALARLA